MADIQGIGHGLFTPPLLKLLKDILDKYPEGGQILKELIQNADDAKATEVKFLLDPRDHGKETLLKPSLGEHQGAALYCYNNGVFTAKDWESIKFVQQSEKKDDPMRVGRFGLGFVSVYHMTDMPSIMSSDRIAFFDPFKTHFHPDKAGDAFLLKKELLEKCEDQFSPYTNILGIRDDQFSQGYYDGTLFRFPLRKTPSPQLSTTIFTLDRVRELFESFKEDADVILLFLKHVTSVSLFELTSDGEEKLVFEVKNDVDDSSGKSNFIEALRRNSNPQPHLTKHKLMIQNGEETSTKHWLVLNSVFTDATERVTYLADQLKLIPWIGLAMPFQDGEVQMIEGRVFCFLPLPPCEESKTGFPIHIHGYFGLSDNRRSLKWPSVDQKHDLNAEWNQHLVEDLLPKAYGLLLTYAVQQSLPPTDVYKAWPKLDKVKPHWADFSERFIDIISDEELLHTNADGGRWISARNALLDINDATISEEDNAVHSGDVLSIEKGTVSQSVIDYLVTCCEQPVVSLPDNVLGFILQRERNKRGISAALLRKCVRKYGVTSCTNEAKTHILQYCLGDGNVGDLRGLPLLRLSSESYAAFSSDSNAASVLLPTTEIPSTILPKQCDAFHFIHPDLISGLGNQLGDVAATKSYQLRFITNDDVVSFLRRVLPEDWFTTDQCAVDWTPGINGHPPEKWLKVLWTWLLESFNGDLKAFHGLPIIPIEDRGQIKQLLKLRDTTPVAFSATESTDDLDNVCSCLKKIGVFILSDSPQYLRHPKLKSYVNEMSPSGVIEVLAKCGRGMNENVKSASTLEKQSLRQILAQLSSSSMSPYRNKIISELPIYDVFPGSGDLAEEIRSSCASSAMVNPLVPFLGKELPRGLRLKQCMVQTDDPDSQNLMHLLGMHPLKLTDVITKYVLPEIETGFYQPTEVDEIMTWVLDSLSALKRENPALPDALKLLSFVNTGDASRRLRPDEAFEPQNETLRNLLQGEDVFPVQLYCQPNTLAALRELGLKNQTDLTPSDVYTVAARCQTENTDCLPNMQRAKALLQCIDTKPAWLSEMVNGKTLLQKLRTMKWISRLQKKPSSYPSFLPWYRNGISLYSPSEIFSKEYANSVGAVAPIIELKVSDDLKRQFEWDHIPPIEVLVKQLEVVVDTWSKRGRKPARINKEVEDIVCALYSHLGHLHETQLRTPDDHSHVVDIMSRLKFPWIWNGYGFTDPQRMALKSNFTFDMKPHLFEIPVCVQEMVEFFAACGVRKEFTDRDMVWVLSIVKETAVTRKRHHEIQRDLQLCVNILDWITRDETEIHEDLRKKMYVPIQSSGDILQFASCAECTYCDNSRLMEEARLKVIMQEEGIELVHERISSKTAQLLGIQPLSQKLAKPDPLGFEFESTGPHEPLTTRLKNILKDYVEGVSIFKELIQNADDAGAEEVKFLIDWRSNTGYNKSLFGTEMEACQGPALWAYNNAVFTDEDLANINKLAGATKMGDTNKVGQFGLGFNSVYHLTDVSSFITRNFFVMFDPHTTHIPNLIKDKTQPGIKLDLEKYPRVLQMYKDQFHVYNTIFGCDLDKNTNYNATLFRFPLRTKVSAKHSEISQNVYDENKMQELVQGLKKYSHSLLLFTQHVKQVRVYQLGPNSLNMNEADELLNITIQESGENTTHGFDKFDEARQTLKVGTAYINKASDATKMHLLPPTPPPPVACMVKTTRVTFDVDSKQQGIDEQLWAISSSISDGEAKQLSLTEDGKEHGLLPCGSVAIKMKFTDFCKYDIEQTRGELFCYLPLNIQNNLPVHTNGSFAVNADRRGIRQHVDSDLKKSIEVRWNELLKKEVISKAYINLIDVLLKSNILHEPKQMYSLWPDATLGPKPPKEVVEGFYSHLIGNCVNHDMPSIFLQDPLIDNNVSLPLSSVKVIDPGMTQYNKQDNDDLASSARQIVNMQLAQAPNDYLRTVDVPKGIFVTFKNLHADVLKKLIITEDEFYQQYLFPNIEKLEGRVRDGFVLKLLKEDKWKSRPYRYLKCLLQQTPCIPVTPNGTKLRRPSDIVDRLSPIVANLFREEDGKFPYDVYGKGKHMYRVKLCELGMAKRHLDWKEVIERAGSIQPLYVSKKNEALERCQHMIKYLAAMKKECPKDVMMSLRKVKFLPLLQKPKHWRFPWYMPSPGDMLSPDETYCPRYKNLVSTHKPVLNDGTADKIPTEVNRLLGLDKEPQIQDVLTHLSKIIDYQIKKTDIPTVEDVCSSVYQYFDETIFKQSWRSHTSNREVANHQALTALREFRKPFLFVDDTFIYPRQLSLKWTDNCAPYLYRMPDYLEKFRDLLLACKVREAFDLQDFVRALKKLADEKQQERLARRELKMVFTWLDQFQDKQIAEEISKDILIPDETGILCPAYQLAYKDVDWIASDGEDYSFVHRRINWSLAKKLGVKCVRSMKLDTYASGEGFNIGEEFGQEEKLTDRIKGVIRDFPTGIEVFKELIQNADDAGASEIHFIYDMRSHKTQTVFNDNWKQLQGPALCVYNDKPFTEGDIKGIQKLGIGGKRDICEATGQYGIGFNAVYHLTDCPSFITNDSDLIVFDPHVMYVPGATRQRPGRRIKVQELQADFPDVVSPYLYDMLRLKGATLFRFPLRTATAKSEISTMAYTELEMDELIDSFKREMRHILLFLNHICTIKLSRIGATGALQCIMSATTKLDTQDEQQRKHISEAIACQAKVIKVEPHKIWTIPPTTSSYFMTVVTDSRDEQQWLIAQKLGFSRMIKDSYSRNEFQGLVKFILPRGGAAMLLTSTCNANQQDKSVNDFQAFCFLPLPIYTGLPFNINGHFALGSDRRNLWREGPGDRWNKSVKLDVIALSLIDCLEKLKQSLPKMGVVDKQMEIYTSVFPQLEKIHQEWKGLAKQMYILLSFNQEKLFPVIKQSTQSNMKTVQWFSFSDVYFDNKSTGQASYPKHSLQSILCEVGFPLTMLSAQVSQDFIESGVQHVKKMTPENVMKFLRGNASTQCSIGTVPCDVTKSTLGSCGHVHKILRFCLKSEESLHGVPLCLTVDNMLRVYDDDEPVYVTHFASLLPQLKHKFIADQLVDTLSERMKSGEEQALKAFTVKDLVANIHLVMPLCWQSTMHYVHWDRSKSDQPSEDWLRMLWCFLHSETSTKKDQLDHFQKWPIIPTVGSKLLPLTLSKTVFGRRSHERDQHSKMAEIMMKKLNCPEVDYDKMALAEEQSDSSIQPADEIQLPGKHVAEKQSYSSLRQDYAIKLLEKHVAHIDSRTDIISVLHHHMQTGQWKVSLDETECISLLKFIHGHAFATLLDREWVRKLKSLPLYFTIFGSPVSIEQFGSSHVLKEGIPTTERHIWIDPCDHIFLKEQRDLWKLFDVLGIKSISQAEVYTKFIFPHFDKFSQEGRLEHLKFIRDTVALSDDVLMSALQSLAFIPNPNGTGPLLRANQCFDPENEIFREMLPTNKFPTAPYDDKEWLYFLGQCGLQKKVDERLFVEFSRQIQDHGHEDIKKSVHQAKLLIDYLFEHSHLQRATFLEEVSVVKFVPVQKPDAQLLSLAPMKSEEELHLTCFKDSVPVEKDKLVWTAFPLLPEWADPNHANKSSTLVNMLGVRYTPSLDMILQHSQYLVEAVVTQSAGEIEESASRNLSKVMDEIYSHLMKCCEEDESGEDMCPVQNSDNICSGCKKIHEVLHDIPFVFVEEKGRMVKTSQVFLKQQTDALEPYLFSIPLKLGPFASLFQLLGSQESPTATQFAIALEGMYKLNRMSELNENDLTKGGNAMKGLFSCLHDNEKVVTGQPGGRPGFVSPPQNLYLLSESKQLHPSSELVFNDMYYRIGKHRGLKCQYLVDLSLYSLRSDPKSLIDRLPGELRPRYLSSLIQEEILPTQPCEESPFCPHEEDFTTLLSSDYFGEAIVRLVSRHSKESHGDGLSERLQQLKNIKVKCVKSLQFHLVTAANQESISGSEKPLLAYFQEDNHLLYLHHSDVEENRKVLITVTRSVCGVLQGMADSIQLYVNRLLELKTAESINEFLEEEGCGSLSALTSYDQLPPLGSVVPQEKVHLLCLHPNYYFRRDEFVGYALDADSEEPTFIYGKIIREVKTPGQAVPRYNIKRIYEVDIGKDELLVVATVDLYKIKRGSSSPEEREESKSLSDVFEQVTDLLEKLSSDPFITEDQQRRAIKRLYLQWHPDKNQGNPEFATEVFKHIKSELERLEGGHLRRKRARTGSGGSNWASSSRRRFSSFYDRWDSEARTYRYRRNEGDGTGSYTSRDGPSQTPRRPDMPEGKRWFRQARADLKAADVDLANSDSESYEWICFKCQQAVEKALKGGLFAVGGNISHQSRSHNMVSLASSLSENSPITDIMADTCALLDLKCNHLHPRYPDMFSGQQIPNDVYTEEKATRAVGHARNILIAVAEIVQEHMS